LEHYSEDLTQAKSEGSVGPRTLWRPFTRAALHVTPGIYTLEVAVLDQNSGKMSAQRSSFEIPDSSAGVSLSDMVLVRKVEGSHLEDEDPMEPLRYEHEKVTPNVSGWLPEQPPGRVAVLHPASRYDREPADHAGNADHPQWQGRA